MTRFESVRHIANNVMIKDGGRERAVSVKIDGAVGKELDLQRLAQKAWLTPDKEMKVGKVIVTVKASRR